MYTPQQRFGTPRAVNDSYDAELINELITIYTVYACRDENRLIGPEFMMLLRLIRTNPAQIIETTEEFANLRTRVPGEVYNDWLPRPEVGLAMVRTKRNPLVQLLSLYLPPTHRVWRYLRVQKQRRYA